MKAKTISPLWGQTKAMSYGRGFLTKGWYDDKSKKRT